MTPVEQCAVMTSPMILLLLILAWTVAFHSRKRWPGVPWYFRLGRIMTFYRDEDHPGLIK